MAGVRRAASPAVAVSDGHMLYAADVATGRSMRDRVLAALDLDPPPLDLWWVSVHGIYRPCPGADSNLAWPAASLNRALGDGAADVLRDHRYHLPSRCFAYVGSAVDTDTRKLPYLLENGEPDTKRRQLCINTAVTDGEPGAVSWFFQVNGLVVHMRFPVDLPHGR
jgi:hypothetical protein